MNEEAHGTRLSPEFSDLMEAWLWLHSMQVTVPDEMVQLRLTGELAYDFVDILFDAVDDTVTLAGTSITDKPDRLTDSLNLLMLAYRTEGRDR